MNSPRMYLTHRIQLQVCLSKPISAFCDKVQLRLSYIYYCLQNSRRPFVCLVHWNLVGSRFLFGKILLGNYFKKNAKMDSFKVSFIWMKYTHFEKIHLKQLDKVSYKRWAYKKSKRNKLIYSDFFDLYQEKLIWLKSSRFISCH